MNKEKVEGKIDEVMGDIKQHVGEWTGDSDMRLQGVAQQLKGTVETAVGKVKDAASDLKQSAVAANDSSVIADDEKRRIRLAENRNLL
jgi:uncharacterized protein YjbJ (UPF0337 family)